MRNLFSEERVLILKIANRLDSDDRDLLCNDLAIAQVDESKSGSTYIIFNLHGYVRPLYNGQHPYAVEARMKDSDNGDVSAVLYADRNNRLLELEFIKWNATKIRNLRWDSVQVFP